MKINSVDMDVMAVRRSQYPSDSLPEFLLIGKSNVGSLKIGTNKDKSAIGI